MIYPKIKGKNNIKNIYDDIVISSNTTMVFISPDQQVALDRKLMPIPSFMNT